MGWYSLHAAPCAFLQEKGLSYPHHSNAFLNRLAIPCLLVIRWLHIFLRLYMPWMAILGGTKSPPKKSSDSNFELPECQYCMGKLCTNPPHPHPIPK